MQCAQFRSLQSHLRVCSCRALARMPGRGARTTPAARVIAGSTRLTNAKRTCGGLVDFASKITQAQPTAMRDNRSGAISASVKLHPMELKRKPRLLARAKVWFSRVFPEVGLLTPEDVLAATRSDRRRLVERS